MADTKGYDDSPPRNGVITFYTVLAVVVLIGVDLLLKSYFAKMMDTEFHDKVATRGFEQVTETRAREQLALEKSGINDAMRTFAQRGRSASPLLAPESGAGKQPVPGWSQLKHEAPPAAAAAAPTQAADVAAQPANPNAADVAAPPPAAAPSPGSSAIAPAARPAPAAPAPH
ncbi:MAG TPA: hypothetical protein VG963_13365 [Polyangiaceae bacterium]|nr:hypothetical protein [Polyangiaceae bacterium]